MNEPTAPIYDARKLGLPKMLILGIQHMFAMFGATILVPILITGYLKDATGEAPTAGLPVAVLCRRRHIAVSYLHENESPGFSGQLLRISGRILHHRESENRHVCADGSK